MHKLGIIVPYRNREDQLKDFVKHINSYLDLDYELIVVDQIDSKPFNRGMLLNIGYLKAKELDCTHLVCHDVDLLPIKVDYTPSDKVRHLVSKLSTPPKFRRDIFDEYIGGVTLVPMEVFEKVNGYSNKYWGWGFEDDDFLLRLKKLGNQTTTKKVFQNAYKGKAVKLGPGSYIKVPNVLNNRKDFKITVEFTINSMLNHPYQITDVQSIFSIPGFDTTLQYDSFQHFSFQFWKKNLDSMSITSKDHFPDGSYKAVIEILNNSNKVRFFINNYYIGDLSFDKLSNLRKSKSIYLGVGDPTREEKKNWADTSIISFKVESDEVLADYNATDGFIEDNSFRGNTAEHVNTQIVNIEYPDITEVTVPYRRNGKFKAIAHEENGYVDGYWKEWGSRENQIRYYDNKYSTRNTFWFDGLTTLDYRLKEELHTNYHHYRVKL